VRKILRPFFSLLQQLVIYLDVVFFENLILNYLIIYVTSKAIRIKHKPVKFLLSSFIGASYLIISIIYPVEMLQMFFAKLILSIIMILVSFKPRTKEDALKYLIIFYMVTYIFGGLVFSLLGNINNNTICLILGITMVALLLISIWKIFRKKINQDSCKCNICIEINGEYINAIALIDTGHCLKDNVNETDVILINKSCLLDVVPNDVLELLTNKEICIPDKFISKIRILNFKTIDKNLGILLGLKIDNVKIYYDGKIVENDKAIIAISNRDIENYDAIINFSLIDGGYICGNTCINKVENKKIVHKIFD
jgi:stage II sporulation protein GA (sporulation sigma-E factor processing peptidase)